MAKVVVYSKNTCPYCVKVKEYLKERGIEFENKDVESDLQARKEFLEKGHVGVPVIVIGDEEIVGFEKDRLDALLT